MKKPKSFRFDEDVITKLDKVHEWYKNRYENNVAEINMYNLYKWSEAQTLSVLIRDKYEELLENGEIENIKEKGINNG